MAMATSKKDSNKGFLTKYKNPLNEIHFSAFKPVEMDLFFSLCTRLKDCGIDPVNITFQEMRRLSSYSAKDGDFVNYLESTFDKMNNLDCRIGDSRNFEKFKLFIGYKVSSTDKNIEVMTNPRFLDFLNSWETGEFTVFELMEHTSIRSGYSKIVYRLLKQYRTPQKRYLGRGGHQWDIDDFRAKLGIPEKYDISAIDRIVIARIKADLAQYFGDLKIEKIKDSKARGRGGSVIAIKITFKAEDQDYGVYKSQSQLSYDRLNQKEKALLHDRTIANNEKRDEDAERMTNELYEVWESKRIFEDVINSEREDKEKQKA